MTRIIGITGGIGCGKSVVSRLLRCHGFRVYDCDSAAKALMENSPALKRDLCNRFGSESLLGDGSINRRHVAGCVFASDEHRLWLNARVHGMVRDDIAAEVAAMDASSAADPSCSSRGDVLFVESAVMKSSRLDTMCDAVWLVTAPLEMRIARVTGRDGCDREHVLQRMDAQSSEFEHFAVPVTRITNDGVCQLLPQIEYLLNLL